MRPLDLIAARLGGLLGVLFLVFGATPAQAQAISDDRLAIALQGLDELARKTIETGAAPGLAIAVVHDDKVVYLKGFGHREAGKPDPRLVPKERRTSPPVDGYSGSPAAAPDQLFYFLTRVVGKCDLQGVERYK